MRPVIGITCNYLYESSALFANGLGVRGQEWQLLADDYITAVEQAGGLPVIIPIYNDHSAAVEMLSHIDGIIFSGGNDLDPNLYYQFPQEEIGNIDSKRDGQDIELARKVITETHLSVLGICRGIQVMNVAMGGTLHQHLPGSGYNCHSLTMYRRTDVTHSVSVTPGSRLCSIFGGEILHVNSFHHQAVNSVASSFRPVAISLDGVIEAIESIDLDRFVVGVQWHPEMLSSNDEMSRRLLSAFVQSCVK